MCPNKENVKMKILEAGLLFMLCGGMIKYNKGRTIELLFLKQWPCVHFPCTLQTYQSWLDMGTELYHN